MKKKEIRVLSFLCSIVLVVSLITAFNITSLATQTDLFFSDFEEEKPSIIFRSENCNGRPIVATDLPGDREGHAIKANLVKSFFGLQPNGIGDTLYKYGDFKEGDTFHLHLDLYADCEGELNIYPFVLLCINGFHPKTKAEKEDNYDEWYPTIQEGTLTINEGSDVIPGQQWVTLDYTFTVKENCSSKKRPISFWTDSGAFYIHLSSSMINKDVYVDNVTIDMDTSNEPTKTLPTETTKSKTTTSTTATPILLGDANSDGNVDMKDILLIRKHMSHMSVDLDLKASDYNQDTFVDMKDILGIRKKMAHVEA